MLTLANIYIQTSSGEAEYKRVLSNFVVSAIQVTKKWLYETFNETPIEAVLLFHSVMGLSPNIASHSPNHRMLIFHKLAAFSVIGEAAEETTECSQDV